MPVLQLLEIQPYTSLAIVGQVPLTTGGVTELELSMDTNIHNELKMTINPVLESHYDFLKNNPNAGVRVRQLDDDQSVIFDMAFIKDRQAQFENASGRVNLTFRSSTLLLDLNNIRYVPKYTVWNGGAFKLISQISPNFIWELVGNDVDISLQTGTMGNIELLNKVVETVGNWSWREKGIDSLTNKTVIQVGDFRKLGVTETARFFENDDIFDTKTIRIVGDPKINLNGDSITHLAASGLNSGGESAVKSSTVFLDDPQADYVKADFPLVDIGERDDSGKILYYIFNLSTYSNLGFNKLEKKEISLSSNSQTIVSNEIKNDFDYKKAQKNVYNQAVAYLRKKSFGQSYSFDFRFPRLILPGTKLYLNYSKYHTYFDKTREIINTSEVVYLKDLKFDLTKFIVC